MKMQINISLQRNQWMMQEVLVVKCLLLTGIWCFIPWKAICGYIYTNPAALQWEVNIYLREIERPVKISSSVRFFLVLQVGAGWFLHYYHPHHHNHNHNHHQHRVCGGQPQLFSIPAVCVQGLVGLYSVATLVASAAAGLETIWRGR